MQWIMIILALILAIPTYGISLILLWFLMPMFGKKTRDEIFPSLIEKAYNLNDTLEVDDVYYEAAVKYAKEHNGSLSPVSNDIWTFYTLINNQKVLVLFGKTLSGGVEITASDAKKFNSTDELMSYLKNSYNA